MALPTKARSAALASVSRMGITVAAVAVVTLIFAKWLPVNPTTAGFAYLITVLLTAAWWGLWESIAASVLATLCFNYFFIPPVGTLFVSSAENWIALFAFLATSLVASQLSESARRRTSEALRREREMERLYALSRAILLTDPEQPFLQQLAHEIRHIYELPGVAVFDPVEGMVYRSGNLEMPKMEQRLQEAVTRALRFENSQTQSIVTPITLDGRAIGSFAVQGTMSEAGLQALSNLVAVALERVHAQNSAARAEAARRSEEFKSTLLDALAHEFKTPLTSIKAAATAILSNGVSAPEQQRELLTIIDQDAGRLTNLVTEAIHMARVEAGKILLNRSSHSIRELVQSVIAQLEIPLEGRPVSVAIAEEVPPVTVDADLVQLALKQVLDNALKYSPADSPILISAELNPGGVAMHIRNSGPGIPNDEKARIFERFYRGRSSRHQVSGSGLGLAIARDILQAHGGDLREESNPGQGVEFVALLPVNRKG